MWNSATCCTLSLSFDDVKRAAKSIHNRGLLIYDREVGQQWLDPKCAVNSLMIRAAILQPLPLELMEALMMF